MNWLGKLFGKKKKTYNKDCSFKLCIINEDADRVSEVLGITDKRAHEIIAFSKDAYERYDKKTESMQAMLDKCTHINEVVFALQAFEQIHDMKAKEHHIGHLLGKLFGRG